MVPVGACVVGAISRGMGATNLPGVHKILCMLDALRHSQTGSVIYRQVERMLDDVVDNQHVVERACVALVNQLLNAYLSHLKDGSPLQVQIRLLQARLQPPLTAGDLEVLRDYIELYASQIEAIRNLDSGLFQNAVNPLLESFGINGGSHRHTGTGDACTATAAAHRAGLCRSQTVRRTGSNSTSRSVANH